ncbi:hypothetical protein SAMN04489724_2014 [Algoriphagus locisalis]|uniref:Lipoprotein n=1 Tax=Algoriphagus locisalis TaxID=305507 RepID=A0A1I7AJC2_9BACT|nr:hypothetical protein [Algoriphagus locisalis]SFT75061.1 hypothetical protein SAMN04489724_2014 [Algoriphagus locisalis]
MRNLLYTILILLFSGCSTEIEDPEPFVPLPIGPGGCNPKDICCFDLSEKSGVYDLFSSWEFAGFQTISNGHETLDNLTCLARNAVFALGGEDYDNLFKVTLQFSNEDSKISACENWAAFNLRTFSNKITGCYSSSEAGSLSMLTPEKGIEYIPNYASTTLPVSVFEDDFLKAIQSVESYEIKGNKLYLSSKGIREKLLFIANEN